MTDKKSLESNKAQDKSRAKQISAEARYIGSNPFELAKGSTSKRKSNVTLKLSHAFGDLESSKRMRVPDDNKLGYAAVATNELSANERNSHAKEDMGVAEEVEKDIQEVDISSRVVNESRGKTKGLDTQDKPSTGTKSKEPGTAFFQLNGAETVPEYDPQLETRVSRSGKTIKTGTVGAFSPVIKTGRKASKQDGSGIIRGDISGDSAINRTEADTRTHGSETGDTSGVDEGEGMSANTSPPVNSAETLLTTHNHAPMNAGKYAAVVKAKTTPRGKRGRPLARGRARARGWVGVVPQHSLPIAGCTGIAKDGNVGETEEVSGIEDRCMSVGEGENEGDDDTAEKELETRLNSGKEVVGECGDTGTKRDGEVAESVGDGAEAETDGEKGQLQKVPGEEKNGGDGMVDSVKGPEAATVAMDTDSADVSTAFEVRDSTEKENMEGCAAGSKDNSGINNNATEEEDTEGCDAGSKDKQVNHNSGINNNATEEADTEISDAGSKDKQVNDNSGINNNATEKADTEVSDADSEDKQVNDNSEINNNAAEKADTEGCDAGSEAKQVNDNSGINNNAAINDSEEGMGAVEYDHKASDVGNGRDVTISTGVLTPQPQTADKTDSTTAESCGRVKSNPDTDTDTDTTCAEKTNSTEQLGDKTGTYGAEVASDMTGDHIGDMVVEDMSEGVVKEDERMDINEPTQAGAPASTCIGTWDSGEGGKPAEEETVTPAEKQLDNHAGTRAGTTTDMHVDSQVDKDTGAQTHTQRDLQKDTPADNPTDTHTDEKIDKETEGLTAEPIGAHTKEEKGTQKSGLADKDAQSHTDTQRIKPDDTHTNKATDSAHADGRNDKQPSPEAGKEIDTHSDTQMVKQDESLVNNSAETHTATQKDKQPDVLTDRDTDTHSGVAMESDEDEREQPQQTHTHTHDTNDRDTRGSRSRSSASASVDVDGAGEAGTRPMRMRDGMGGSTGNGRGKARALMGRPRGIKGAKRKRETVSGSVDGVEVEHGVGNMVGMGEDDSGNTSVGSGAHADMGLKARAKTRRKPGKGGAKRPHINKYATTGDLYADLVEIDQDEVNALFFPKYDPAAMVWNSTHTINQKNKYCYCGGKRTRKNCDLYCDQCNNWFHLDCVKINNSPTLAYGLHYKFVCKACVYTYDTRVALTAARDAKELQSGTKETSAPQAMDINSETQKEGPNDSTKGAEIGLNRTEAVDVIEKAVDGEVDRADAKTDTGDKISSGVRISSGVSISSEVNSSGEPSTGTGTGKKKANTVENVKGNEKSDTTATQTTDDVAMVNKDTPSQGATADNTADITESVQEIFFQESRQTWQPVVTQAMAILTARIRGKNHRNRFFSTDVDIIPFIDQNWVDLWGMDRKKQHRWGERVLSVLSTDKHTFKLKDFDENVNDPEWQLAFDVYDLKPALSHSSIKKLRAKALLNMGGTSKTKTGGTNSSRVNPTSTDFIVDRNGYRYIDAEPDPFRKGRDTFRPCLLSEEVVLSHQKRARQLKLSDDRLSVTGARGYCLAMATHCVRRGTYYYEVKLLPPEPVSDELPTSTSYMSGLTAANKTTRRPNNNANTGTSDANTGTAHPPGRTSGSPVPPPKSNAHVRLGWSQSYALHQGPVGYDHFSYSYRDKSGSKFHRSLGQPYGEAYETGDVIGCLIHMPDYTLSEDLFNSALTIVNPGKQHDIDPLNTEMLIVDFKGIPYYQITDELDRSLKALEPVEGSYIEFFKNGKSQGKAFTNINSGLYYPAVSLYMGANVKLNFGPDFEFPIPDTTSATDPHDTPTDTSATTSSTLTNRETISKPVKEGTIKEESNGKNNGEGDEAFSPMRRRVRVKKKPVKYQTIDRYARKPRGQQYIGSQFIKVPWVPKPLSNRVRPMSDVQAETIADMVLSDILLKTSMQDDNLITTNHLGPIHPPITEPKVLEAINVWTDEVLIWDTDETIAERKPKRIKKAFVRL